MPPPGARIGFRVSLQARIKERFTLDCKERRLALLSCVHRSFLFADVRKIGAPYLSKTIRNKPSWILNIVIMVVLFKHIWTCVIATLFSIKILNPLLNPSIIPETKNVNSQNGKRSICGKFFLFFLFK